MESLEADIDFPTRQMITAAEFFLLRAGDVVWWTTPDGFRLKRTVMIGPRDRGGRDGVYFPTLHRAWHGRLQATAYFSMIFAKCELAGESSDLLMCDDEARRLARLGFDKKAYFREFKHNGFFSLYPELRDRGRETWFRCAHAHLANNGQTA